MRGYYGIGVEGISKPYNLGNLFRSAHAFDASFVFTVNAAYKRRNGKHSDTSDALRNLPFYEFDSVGEMILPKGLVLIPGKYSRHALSSVDVLHHLDTAAR